MPVLSFALEHEIVTLTWIDNASVQFPLNIYATKGFTCHRTSCHNSCIGTDRGSLKFRGPMIGGVASSCRPLRDCNRRDRKRSQRHNGDAYFSRSAFNAPPQAMT